MPIGLVLVPVWAGLTCPPCSAIARTSASTEEVLALLSPRARAVVHAVRAHRASLANTSALVGLKPRLTCGETTRLQLTVLRQNADEVVVGHVTVLPIDLHIVMGTFACDGVVIPAVDSPLSSSILIECSWRLAACKSC